MRTLFFAALLAFCVSLQAQNPASSSPSSNAPSSNSSNTQNSSNQQAPASTSQSKPPMPGPNSAPPRSDRVDAAALDDGPGESSSKDTQVEFNPPASEDKAGADDTMDTDGDVMEMRPFDPHKAAKDIEVGDFYFKVKKNYIAAEARYREALYYKKDDALATFKLAVCLDRMGRPDEAQAEYENYLKILPNGPEASEAKKALEKLKTHPESAKPAK